MQLHVGTSGYSYKEWKGSFYPEKISPGAMLGHYAERLPAVEINNTFYRMPKTSVLESWAEQVPSHFRFAIKASRRITHFKRLKEADEPLGFLLQNVEALGDKLGVLLFQLPPNLKCDVDRLAAFVALLPPGTRAVFEFRHPSWEDEAVLSLLRERQLGLVGVDGEEAPLEALPSTAPYGYLRLRRPDYDAAALADWTERIAAQGWQDAFIFFKHEDEAAGPKMAAQFLELSGRRRAVPARRRGAAREAS